jgi:hypothetical protein
MQEVVVIVKPINSQQSRTVALSLPPYPLLLFDIWNKSLLLNPWYMNPEAQILNHEFGRNKLCHFSLAIFLLPTTISSAAREKY